MVRNFVESSENSWGAVRHCKGGLDADLAEYLARKQLPVLNGTDNSPSDGAECGDSASGEDEFDEGYLDSVNRHKYYKKRMCRFGSQCWRPHCWFRHGNGDRMKQIVKMAHYWTQEVKRLFCKYRRHRSSSSGLGANERAANSKYSGRGADTGTNC